MRSLTNSVFGAVGVATLVAVLIMVIGTWGIWALAPIAASGLVVFLPALLALLVQVALMWATLRGRGFSPALVSVAVVVGLAALLVVGGSISEMVHCSFDRRGCINL